MTLGSIPCGFLDYFLFNLAWDVNGGSCISPFFVKKKALNYHVHVCIWCEITKTEKAYCRWGDQNEVVNDVTALR